MTWPEKDHYNEAIQSLRYSIRDEDLRAGEPALAQVTPLGFHFS